MIPPMLRKAIQHAKKDKAALAMAEPSALGDTEEEKIEALEAISSAGVKLVMLEGVEEVSKLWEAHLKKQ